MIIFQQGYSVFDGRLGNNNGIKELYLDYFSYFLHLKLK